MLLSMQSYGKMREKANFICTFPNASNFSEGKVTKKVCKKRRNLEN